MAEDLNTYRRTLAIAQEGEPIARGIWVGRYARDVAALIGMVEEARAANAAVAEQAHRFATRATEQGNRVTELEAELARLAVLCPDCPGWGEKSKSGLHPGGPWMKAINEG
jgi:hypothetical protein